MGLEAPFPEADRGSPLEPAGGLKLEVLDRPDSEGEKLIPVR
jgi:hypothetical protein